MAISAIIMAAGFSRRFGKDKLKVGINCMLCIEYVLEAVKAGDFQNRVCVSNDEEVKQICAEYGIACVANENAEVGRSSSIRAGINAVNENSDYMFFVGDQPFINTEIINTMLKKHYENPQKIIAPLYGEKMGNPIIFPNSFKQRLLQLQGENGGKTLINENNLMYCHFEEEFSQDVDSKEDYNKVLLKKSNCVIVRGGGDIATGVIQKFHRSGFNVVILEVQKPTAIRRAVSLCDAVYDREKTVEDMTARLVTGVKEARNCFKQGIIPLLVDPKGEFIEKIGAFAIIDAVMAKRNLGTNKSLAPITVGLGPGFTAGEDVDAVIETMRGHNLGKIITEGKAAENTGIPAEINGFGKERVVYSPYNGVLKEICQIGDCVKAAQTIAMVGESEIKAQISGILRGMIRNGFEVKKGMKIADIDPRFEEAGNFMTISDKARAIGGGALEAVLWFGFLRQNLTL